MQWSKRTARGKVLAAAFVPLIALVLVSTDARAQSDGSAANIARLELRIADLETQIRNLTGQIERLSFDLRQANDRLDRAMSDTEYRLTTLEGGTPAAASPAPASDQSASVSAGSTLQPADQAPQAGDSQVLGTLTVNSEGATTGAAAGAAQSQVAAAPANPDADIATRYNNAYALLQNRDFAGAESAFSSFVDSYPNHPLASNARYWAGESLYARGQFPEAASSFALGYQQYPQGAKALDSLFKLGMTFAAMGQKQDACATFGQIDVEFPSAPQGIQRRVAQEIDRLQCG